MTTQPEQIGEPLSARSLDWIERDVLRGTESPADWGVPPDYAAGFIAGVHSFRDAVARLAAIPATPDGGDCGWCGHPFHGRECGDATAGFPPCPCPTAVPPAARLAKEPNDG